MATGLAVAGCSCSVRFKAACRRSSEDCRCGGGLKEAPGAIFVSECAPATPFEFCCEQRNMDCICRRQPHASQGRPAFRHASLQRIPAPPRCERTPYESKRAGPTSHRPSRADASRWDASAYDVTGCASASVVSSRAVRGSRARRRVAAGPPRRSPRNLFRPRSGYAVSAR